MQRSDARKLQEERLHRPAESLGLTNDAVALDYAQRELVVLRREVEAWKMRALAAEERLSSIE